MYKLFEHAADIIKAASGSPLGIIALICIVFGILGFLFFRKSSESIRLAVFLVLFGGIGLFAFLIIHILLTTSPTPVSSPPTPVSPPPSTVSPPPSTVSPPPSTVSSPLSTVSPPLSTVSSPLSTVSSPPTPVSPPLSTVSPNPEPTSSKPTSESKPESDKPLIKTQKQEYKINEAIRVEYSGLPGNQKDWITLVKADAPENTKEQSYTTEGEPEGSLTFEGLPAGKYEVRLYYDWPKGGYNVKARYSFSVR